MELIQTSPEESKSSLVGYAYQTPDCRAVIQITDGEKAWIQSLVGHAPKKSAVHAILLHLSETGSAPENIEVLVRTLANPAPKLWRERLACAWALGRIPILEEQKDVVVTLLSDVVGNRLSENRVMRGVSRSYLIALCITAIFALIMIAASVFSGNPMVVLSTLVGGILISLLGAIPLSFLISPIVVPVSMATDKSRVNNTRGAAVVSLGRLRSVHGIAALADAAVDSDQKVRESAWDSLRATLDLLTPADFGLMSLQTVPSLCRLLGEVKYTHKPSVVAVLEALEKVGDSRAIPAVESIARQGFEPRHDLARRVLTVLCDRKRMEDEFGRLLRPSANPDEDSAVLLRPAGCDETDSELLLRVAEMDA